MNSDSMFTGFNEVMADVVELESKLESPAEFYASHRAEYVRQAVQIAREVLSAMRPPETSQEDWQRKSQRVVSRITVDLLADGTGIFFNFGEADDVADGSVLPKDARPDRQMMTYDDIVKWVEAGIRGEPGGKRITKIDQEMLDTKGVKGVASIVTRAYYSFKPDPAYARLRAAIQRYMLGVRADESDPLLDAVSAAWEAHFEVVIRRDLDDYVASLCDQFNSQSGHIAVGNFR